MAAANELEVRCPAGYFIGETDDGPTIECRVEQNLIGARTSPNTVSKFCCCDYTDCPTWRAEKERLWAKQPELVSGPR